MFPYIFANILCTCTSHEMYFPLLHGEYMEKWKEHCMRSVQTFYLKVLNVRTFMKSGYFWNFTERDREGEKL
jgi:hypothetical protein